MRPQFLTSHFPSTEFLSLTVGLCLLIVAVVARADESRSTSERIDQLLAQSWQAEEITPAEPCSDSEFLRRTYLDLTGVVPTVSEAYDFLTDSSQDKHDALVDKLLQSPQHANHMANLWRNILISENVQLQDLPNVLGLQNWLRQQFARNLPFDTLVAEFLMADRLGANGPGVFYTSLDLEPKRLAARTAQAFLGIQMQCAECHDHPFDDWTQEDFWGYASFFAQIERRSIRGDSRIEDTGRGEVMIPDTDEVVLAKYPGGRLADPKEGGSRRDQLAIWMASRHNPYLARAVVNRVWNHLFARGLVEPVDDMNKHNPPSHPELLSELSAHFTANRFNLRDLYATLCKTNAYRLSSSSLPENDDRAAELFARMNIKTLSAEQLYDSLKRFLPRVSQTMVPGQPFSSQDLRRRLDFVRAMRNAARNPREYQRGAPQALLLMNGGQSQLMTGKDQKSFLSALASPIFDEAQQVESLYLATVTRPPTDQELSTVSNYLTGCGPDGREQALGDVLWALVNSSEFNVNH